MTPLATIAATLFCAALEISAGVSPDQPLPFSYTDDPLVVELLSTVDLQAEPSLHAEFPGAPVADVKIAPIFLRANLPALAAFPGLANTRGLFRPKLSISASGETQELELVIARIERPANTAPGMLPVFVHTIETAEHVVAARAAGAAAVSISITNPKFAELVRAAAPMGVVPFVRAADREAVGTIAALDPELIKNIVRWTIDPAGDVAVFQQIADAIRSTPCKAPLALYVSDAATFERMMKDGVDKAAHAVVLASDVTTGKEARLLLDAAERAGHEGWPLLVLASGAQNPEAPAHALQQTLANLAAGAEATGVAAHLLYDGKAMGEAFVALNALSGRLSQVTHAGNISVGGSVSAPLFRDGAHWLLALWSEGAGRDVEVRTEGAQELKLTDAMGNAAPLPALKDGALSLRVGAMPVLLSGVGGPLPGEAARNKAQNTARRLLDDKTLQRWITPELRALVQAVADRKGELDRPSVLALLRALPELERQWHEGKLPRVAAVPMIADISRLCRMLSATDEEKGQAYLEPMHDMLARSEEMQSIYLTGAGGGADDHQRGDWILNEVRRLIDESKKLAVEERKIEAAGVAALAEARARSLEYAAKEGDKSHLSEYDVMTALGQVAAPTVAPAVAPAPDAGTPATAKPEETMAAEPAKVAEKPTEKPAEKEDVKEEAKEEAKEEPAAKADEKLAPGQPKGTRKISHTVARGDTPESIAKKYGADFEAFRKANGLRVGAQLKPGKQYVVFAPVAAEKPKEARKEKEKEGEAPAGAQPADTKKITHKVAKGDNPSVIAKKYGVSTEDFLKWNNLKSSARFQIGEEYIVYVKR